MNAAVSPHLRSLEALQAQISAQNEISCLLREQLHDLRINRDAWRTQAEAAQHILVDGRPRRRLFGWSSTIGKVDALFKRCLLLILFAAVLLTPSNLIPVSQENIEAVFRCLLPAFDQLALPAEKTGISTLRFVSPTYTSEERDYLIRTIAFEASGEPDEGKAAVAHVILTRKRSGKWGDTIKEVVTHPGQFESWMTKRAEMESLDVEDHRYRSAAQIADAVLAGQMLIQLQAQLISSIQQLFAKGAELLCRPGPLAGAHPSAGTRSMRRMRSHGWRESRDPPLYLAGPGFRCWLIDSRELEIATAK